MRRLEALRVLAEGSVETLAATSVPSDAGAANGYLVAATGSWNSGIELLNDAIVVVLGGSAEAGGTELLEGASDFLRLGDLAYNEFLAAAEGLDDATVSDATFTVEGDTASFEFTRAFEVPIGDWPERSYFDGTLTGADKMSGIWGREGWECWPEPDAGCGHEVEWSRHPSRLVRES